MANAKEIKASYAVTGVTIQVRIKREADGYLLNDADGTFAAAPGDSLVDLTEHATLKGLYEKSESRTAWNDGKYTVTAYVSTDLNTIVASGQIYILGDKEVELSLLQNGGYEGGAVWIDETNGSAGTESYVNGTKHNPVDNWADALVLAAALNLRKFYCPVTATAVSITLTASFVGYEFEAPNGTLALAGYDVAGTIFKGCNPSGTYVGHPHFYDCEIGNITGGNGHFHNCGLAGDIVANAASGGWFFDGCYEVIASSFDYGAANIVLRMDHFFRHDRIKEYEQYSTIEL